VQSLTALTKIKITIIQDLMDLTKEFATEYPAAIPKSVDLFHTLRKQNRIQEAENFILPLHEIARQRLGSTHTTTIDILIRIASLKAHRDTTPKANKHWSRPRENYNPILA
jgi:hypothetical protein